MNAPYFREDNTDGYSQAQLDALNRALAQSVRPTDSPDQIQWLAERLLVAADELNPSTGR